MAKSTHRPPPGAAPSIRHASIRHGGRLHAYKPRAAGTVEEATLALIDACGGRKAVVALPGCHVSGSMLDKYTSDAEEDRGKHMPAKLIAYLESVCGKPVLSAWIAAQSGHTVVPLPDAAALDLPAAVARLGKESGDVFARAGQALADGRVGVDEALRLKAELMDVVDVCMGLGAGLDGLIGERVG